MTPKDTVKAPAAASIVAVILSPAQLARGRRMRKLPDLFEIRLDGLAGSRPAVLRESIAALPAPRIITARHPAEGAVAALSSRARRALLQQHMDLGSYVDLELRTVRSMPDLIEQARARKMLCILSVHEWEDAPPLQKMIELAGKAIAAGADVFKLAVRTDTRSQLDRLFAAYDAIAPQIATSAMGIGRYGKSSREHLARAGSVLNYGHLGKGSVPGQLSVAELRRILSRSSPLDPSRRRGET